MTIEKTVNTLIYEYETQIGTRNKAVANLSARTIFDLLDIDVSRIGSLASDWELFSAVDSRNLFLYEGFESYDEKVPSMILAKLDYAVDEAATNIQRANYMQYAERDDLIVNAVAESLVWRRERGYKWVSRPNGLVKINWNRVTGRAKLLEAVIERPERLPFAELEFRDIELMDQFIADGIDAELAVSTRGDR